MYISGDGERMYRNLRITFPHFIVICFFLAQYV
uniref:Uncharacterized protein n=1 Tax=Anguilla anguilla TaxID=7936 RepID=A0A0E9T1B3_ANGAN